MKNTSISGARDKVMLQLELVLWLQLMFGLNCISFSHFTASRSVTSSLSASDAHGGYTQLEQNLIPI